ncbi:Ig-like domain-containing protein [Aeromonas veronii]
MTKLLIKIMALVSVVLVSGCHRSSGGSTQTNSCERVVFIQVAPKETLLNGVSRDQLPLGISTKYAATMIYCDGTTRVATDGIKWSVSNDNASITPDGLVTSRSPGSVQVIATFDSLNGERTLDISDAVISDISISPQNASLPKGMALQYSASATYDDGSSLDITELATWSSNAKSIATVNHVGVVSGLEEGVATITATFNGKKVETTINVSSAVLTDFNVSPSELQIPKGIVARFKAQAIYSDGSDFDVTDQVAWVSSDPIVAAVDSVSGIATPTIDGVTTISATFKGKEAKAMLSVTDATLTALTVDPNYIVLPKGVSKSYVALGDYSDGQRIDVTDQVDWSSFSPSVANISNNGIAQALNQGSSTITAKLGGYTATVQLDVSSAVLTSIKIDNATPSLTRTVMNNPTEARNSLPKGVNHNYTAQGYYSDGSSKEVTRLVRWFSEDPELVTINNHGVATGIQAGDTNVVAQLDGIRASVPLTITNTGSLVAWGDPKFGGDISDIEQQLTNVQSVHTSGNAYAALKHDGSVVTWGAHLSLNPHAPSLNSDIGDSSHLNLTHIKSLWANSLVNTALATRKSGDLVSWGNYVIKDWSRKFLKNIKNVFVVSGSPLIILQNEHNVLIPMTVDSISAAHWDVPLVSGKWAFPFLNPGAPFEGFQQLPANYKGDTKEVDVIPYMGQRYIALRQYSRHGDIEKLIDKEGVAFYVKTDGSLSSASSYHTLKVGDMYDELAITGMEAADFKSGEKYTKEYEAEIAAFLMDNHINTEQDLAAIKAIHVVPGERGITGLLWLKDDGQLMFSKQGAAGLLLLDGVDRFQYGVRDPLNDAADPRAKSYLPGDLGVVTKNGLSSLYIDKSGDVGAVQVIAGEIVSITSNYGKLFDSQAHAVLKRDGTVVTFGHANLGGDSSSVEQQLTNVKEIVGTGGYESLNGRNNSLCIENGASDGASFAALKHDGTVVTWGGTSAGDSSLVQPQLKNVQTIIGGCDSFVALIGDE